MNKLLVAVLFAATPAAVLAQTTYHHLEDDLANWSAANVSNAGTATCGLSFSSDPLRPGHHLITLSLTDASGPAPICALIYKGIPAQDPSLVSRFYGVQSVAWLDPNYTGYVFGVAGEILTQDDEGVSKIALQARFSGKNCEGFPFTFQYDPEEGYYGGGVYAWGNAFCGGLGYVTFYSDDLHTAEMVTSEQPVEPDQASDAQLDRFVFDGFTDPGGRAGFYDSDGLFTEMNGGSAGLGASKTIPTAIDPARGQVWIRYTLQMNEQRPQSLTVGSVNVTMQ